MRDLQPANTAGFFSPGINLRYALKGGSAYGAQTSNFAQKKPATGAGFFSKA
jgi:hypothetical protein